MVSLKKKHFLMYVKTLKKMLFQQEFDPDSIGKSKEEAKVI